MQRGRRNKTLHLHHHSNSFLSSTAIAFSCSTTSLCNSANINDEHSDEQEEEEPANNNNNNKAINLNQDGKCKFGTKEYWDSMYTEGTDGEEDEDRPPDDASSSSYCYSYSWYCTWNELAPFWNELVLLNDSSDDDYYDDDYDNPKSPPSSVRVLIPGIGNDPTPVEMFDAGFTDMIAFDYSEAAVERAKALFDTRRRRSTSTTSTISTFVLSPPTLLCADATQLPLADASIDATLDKGTLDAIWIASPTLFHDAVRELGRVTAVGGIVMCISKVVDPDAWGEAFSSKYWETIHDGGLAFAPDGEATIDLGANLYSFRRTAKVPYQKDEDDLQKDEDVEDSYR
jgi:hypothetical protein